MITSLKTALDFTLSTASILQDADDDVTSIPTDMLEALADDLRKVAEYLDHNVQKRAETNRESVEPWLGSGTTAPE